jgi:hypothetical protein
MYTLSGLVGSVYPSITMPPFRAVLARAGIVHAENLVTTVVSSDGSTTPVTLRELLSPAPGSHHIEMARYRFRHRPIAPEARQWLRGRMESLFPQRRVRSVVFEWFTDRFEARYGWARTARRLNESVDIEN